MALSLHAAPSMTCLFLCQMANAFHSTCQCYGRYYVHIIDKNGEERRINGCLNSIRQEG